MFARSSAAVEEAGAAAEVMSPATLIVGERVREISTRRNALSQCADGVCAASAIDVDAPSECGMPAPCHADDDVVVLFERRAADVCFERLNPTKFTREGWLQAAASQIPQSRFAVPLGSVWSSFEEVTFLGEGAFGFVWRGTTPSGERVAIKSCPVSFHATEAIDDAYSVLREVAVMSFLGKMRCPNVLPLIASFLVHGADALPPHVVCRLDEDGVPKESQQQRKKAEKRKRGAEEEVPVSAAADPSAPSVTKTALQHRDVPPFTAISLQDCRSSDATVFLITELCDGDLEHVEPSESVTRGVGIQIGQALQCMHRLGVVHLDVKPSNILYQSPRHPGAPTRFLLGDFGNCAVAGPMYLDAVESIGTYEYMDTAALSAKRCDRATDAYSLGCTLYQLLTGKALYPPCRKRHRHTTECFLAASRKAVALGKGTLSDVVTALLRSNRASRMTCADCVAALSGASCPSLS